MFNDYNYNYNDLIYIVLNKLFIVHIVHHCPSKLCNNFVKSFEVFTKIKNNIKENKLCKNEIILFICWRYFCIINL